MTEGRNPCFVDKELICVDCGEKFTWNIGEQEYFWSKKLSPPKRCSKCRRARKESLVRDSGWR